MSAQIEEAELDLNKAKLDLNKDLKIDREKIIKTILSLYKEYSKLQISPYIVDTVNADLLRLEKLKMEDLYKLKIELPLDEIISIFNKTGVIQLRKADSSKKLLLGCGNSPLIPATEDGLDHEHAGFVTVNPELTMNPDIVGAFGVNKGLNQVLLHNFYDNLYCEAVTIGNTVSDCDTDCLQCMKMGFKVYEIGDKTPLSFEDSNLFFNDPVEDAPPSSLPDDSKHEHEKALLFTQKPGVYPTKAPKNVGVQDEYALYSLLMCSEDDNDAAQFIVNQPDSLETLHRFGQEEVISCVLCMKKYAKDIGDETLDKIMDAFIQKHEFLRKTKERSKDNSLKKVY